MTNRFPDLLDTLSDLALAVGTLVHFCPLLLFHFLALDVLRVEIYVWIINFGSSRRRTRSRRYGPLDRTGETLANFKAVRAFNRQSAAEENYQQHLMFHANKSKSPNLVRQLWIGIDFAMGFMDTCITTIYSGSLVIGGQLGLTTLSSIQSSGRSLLWRTWRLLETLGVIRLPWYA